MLSSKDGEILDKLSELECVVDIIEYYQQFKDAKNSDTDCSYWTALDYKFEEVNYFYQVMGRLPKSDSSSFKEKSLARFLESVANDKSLFEELKANDTFNLLNQIYKHDEESDESPDYSALDSLDGYLDIDEDYLNMVKGIGKHTNPDRIAQMVECNNFDQFKHLFEKIRQSINIGSHTLVKYKGGISLNKGSYIFYKGHIGYIAFEGKPFKEEGKPTNRRLKIIYDNGMEIDMLYLSLKRSLALYPDVFVIVPSILKNNTSNGLNGEVYILKTENTDPVLDKYRDDLYKVGYTCNEVHTRLLNAESSTTYLEAPVRLIGTLECAGRLDPRTIEKKIHSLLSIRRLNVSLINSFGQIYKPREWFHVPLDTIKEIVTHINDGTIDNYYVSPVNGKLIRK